MSDRVFSFYFDKDKEERLDIFLTACLPEFSRSRLQGLIKDGFVRVDGAVATKPSRSLGLGAAVEVRIPPPTPSNWSARPSRSTSSSKTMICSW